MHFDPLQVNRANFSNANKIANNLFSAVEASLPLAEGRATQQRNGVDCGVFVLGYTQVILESLATDRRELYPLRETHIQFWSSFLSGRNAEFFSALRSRFHAAIGPLDSPPCWIAKEHGDPSMATRSSGDRFFQTGVKDGVHVRTNTKGQDTKTFMKCNITTGIDSKAGAAGAPLAQGTSGKGGGNPANH